MMMAVHLIISSIYHISMHTVDTNYILRISFSSHGSKNVKAMKTQSPFPLDYFNLCVSEIKFLGKLKMSWKKHTWFYNKYWSLITELIPTKERPDQTNLNPLWDLVGRQRVTSEDRSGWPGLIGTDHWSNTPRVPLLPRSDSHILALLSDSYLFLSFLLGSLHLNLLPVSILTLLYPQSLVFLVVTRVLLQNWGSTVFFLVLFLRKYSRKIKIVLIST